MTFVRIGLLGDLRDATFSAPFKRRALPKPWEWYFMAANWVAFNSGKNETNIPIQLVVTQYNEITPLFYVMRTDFRFSCFRVIFD